MIYKRILIAIDEEPSAEKVAQKGLQLGKQLNAEIAIISVANTTDLLTDGGVTPDEMAEIIRKDTRESQKKIRISIFKDYEVTQFVEEGKPYEVILKVAGEWNADILVIGTQSKSGLSQVLLGSVSEKVIKNSKIPVFLVTTKG
ncbi:universal stress protein [Gillisia sp. Q332]|uniref:universal stress protein n=1 Tax=Gillisia xinjiangensis TaxID=3384765 RepID=UPI00391DC014